MLKALKIPKTIGACADLLYNLRAQRLELQKQVDAISKDESALKEHIIAVLPKSDTGAAGKFAQISVKTNPVPQVEDWDALYTYIKKTGDFDLLHRRLANKAVEDRWENNKEIPGVTRFNLTTVSLNKL